MWLTWYICKFTERKKSTSNILYLVLYSARSRNVTWHRIFLGLQSKKSQIWSLPVSYSIRQAVEMWETLHIFWVYRAKNGNLGYSLSRTLFGTRQKCDIHRRFLSFKTENNQVWIILILYSIQKVAKLLIRMYI